MIHVKNTFPVVIAIDISCTSLQYHIYGIKPYTTRVSHYGRLSFTKKHLSLIVGLRIALHKQHIYKILRELLGDTPFRKVRNRMYVLSHILVIT